ncbi:MAG TPA: FAD-binding protein [Candidatus Coprenecus pullicola]|nr:FAD-binding protein [Candidatus Coprenecus pullicola]
MKEFETAFEASYAPTEEDFRAAAAKAAGVPAGKISEVRLLRRSIDARSRNILRRYRLAAYLQGEVPPETGSYNLKQDVSQKPPVIVIGAGPAGLFAALRLICGGRRPIILERGRNVHERKYDIAAISRTGGLNPDSNYCFGEGGAGTFSDGKLYTRSNKRGDVGAVLKTFADFGADPMIRIDAHPHIGSDRLPAIVEAMRLHIEECGGQYHFSCRVTDLQQIHGGGWKVLCDNGSVFEAPEVILATGHSASDIYRLFIGKGWAVEAKGFALGVRAEHPQELVDRAQYHGPRMPWLPAAEYSLVEQVDGRGVFSFCMCPGGILVPSSTEPGTVVTNGMSNSQRNSRWANAGIVTSVEPQDVADFLRRHGSCPAGIGSESGAAEAMLDFRHEVERRCYAVSGSFRAPAQRMTDFVKSRKGKSVVTALPRTSYAPGAFASELNEVLPDFVAGRLRKAFPAFDRKLRGYYTAEALLLAVESRTSSPVRLPRDPLTLQHVNLPNLYPCGEGAGYSGGIVSSAIDGVRAAEHICNFISC